MKVIAILENLVTAGGGFNQALNAILQMKRICDGRFEFEVFTTWIENVEYLSKIGIDATGFSLSLADRLLSKVALNSWWQTIQNRVRFVGPLEKQLTQHRCDLVYFLTPSETSSALQRLNYITTVWDLCHRDTPEFPEVREFSKFQARERNYQNWLSPAVLTLTDSVQLTEAISRRYGIDRDRLLAMPFAPAPFLDAGLSKDKAAVMSKYALEEGYFFYPSQLWAHKNHIRILEAIVMLAESGIKPKVVFAGGDQGNKGYLESFVNKNRLGEQVRFLGFVPAEDMRGLYEGCHVVVMPTYFGPTNLPPLEAWMLGKPLIYSSHLQEQVGEAAICVNPDDEEELAEAMRACANSETCARLVMLGCMRLQQLEQQRAEAESELAKRIMQFAAKRRCWA